MGWFEWDIQFIKSSSLSSSNLLVEKILSVVAIKISKFLHEVKGVLPKGNVCVNTKSILCDIF